MTQAIGYGSKDPNIRLWLQIQFRFSYLGPTATAFESLSHLGSGSGMEIAKLVMKKRFPLWSKSSTTKFGHAPIATVSGIPYEGNTWVFGIRSSVRGSRMAVW